MESLAGDILDILLYKRSGGGQSLVTPRTSRASRGGFVYHVLNRGHGRSDVFHKDDDFAAFVNLKRAAHAKVPMQLTRFCLMTDISTCCCGRMRYGDLSRWMQSLMTSHVPRYQRHSKGSGHVWQRRFKAFPVQSDEHSLTVLRDVERNPLRANMVERSQDWEWSSLKPTARSGLDGLLCNGPILKPAQWTRHVNGAETETELSFDTVSLLENLQAKLRKKLLKRAGESAGRSQLLFGFRYDRFTQEFPPALQLAANG